MKYFRTFFEYCEVRVLIIYLCFLKIFDYVIICDKFIKKAYSVGDISVLESKVSKELGLSLDFLLRSEI